MSKILIVDDDPQSRKLLETYLAGEGYELSFAETGAEALEKVMSIAPDLVLLDAVMPGMDGLDVCRHLRLDPLLAEIPVVMITGLADLDTKLAGFEAGVDDFVAKPLDRWELKARVRNIVTLNRYRKLIQERAEHERDKAEREAANETMLKSWAYSLEMRGVEPPGHIRRLIPLTLRLARQMGMPEDSMDEIRTGVLLHDCGKIGIPDSTLLEQDNAGTRDRGEVLKHPKYACDLISSVRFLRTALTIPYSHHEKWDGTGYPQGLKGEEIPLPARVFAVADAWDTLCAEQSGEGARSKPRMLANLRARAGSDFDPSVVGAFEKMITDETSGVQAVAGFGVEDEREKTLPRRRRRSVSLSLASRGALVHFLVAVALTSIIPILVLANAPAAGLLTRGMHIRNVIPIAGTLLGGMVLGHLMLAKYPLSIVRLRRLLETLAKGDFPLRVDLETDENDLAAIEMSMKNIVARAEERVRTIESQTQALLEAERQRVAIEGLGAACHHLGQPASTLRLGLEMIQNAKTPEERDLMIEQCQKSTRAISDVLLRLQRIASYRSEPYLASGANLQQAQCSDILEV